MAVAKFTTVGVRPVELQESNWNLVVEPETYLKKSALTFGERVTVFPHFLEPSIRVMINSPVLQVNGEELLSI